MPPPGFVDERARAPSCPGLRLDWMTVAERAAIQPAALVSSGCESLSNRYRGASVVAMRTQPIPHAYRTFFRQIGLDPDVDRIPSEEAAVSRLLHGGFRSRGALEDALLIALIETGVPVWALDADLVDAGGLGIRTTVDGDRPRRRRAGSRRRRRAGSWSPTPAASTRCCSASSPPGTASGSRTRRIALFSVGVEGVPAIHVEEALWVCAEVLANWVA